MPFITRVLDQKEDLFRVVLLQRELPVDMILSDGVNVARFRVTRTKEIATTGRDFAITEKNLTAILDAPEKMR
jgi:hypothetical protein